MRVVVLVCLLGGCDLVLSADGSAGNPGGDGGIDVPSDGDLDDDGLPDESDNCPAAANADQHDEDGDGVGDVCDNCPTITNTNQANTLESPPDDLGDACDSETSTQCILLFDPFTRLPASISVGDWRHGADEDSIQQLDGLLDNAIYMLGDNQYTAERIVTTMHIKFLATDDQFHSAGLWHSQGIASVPPGIVAEYVDARTPAASTPAVLHLGQPVMGAEFGMADFDMPVTMTTSGLGSDIVLALDLRDASKAFTEAGVDIARAEQSGVPQGLSAGRAGFRTNHASAVFDHILVVQNRGSDCPPR